MKLAFFLVFSLTVYLGSSQKYYKEPKQFPLVGRYKNFLVRRGKDGDARLHDKFIILQDEWHDFKEKDPRYHNATFVKQCQENYLHMEEEIKAHHAAYQLKLTTFDRKLQRWSDLSKKEKIKSLCGARLPRRIRAPTNAAYLRIIRSWLKVPPGTQVNHCNFPNPIPDQQSCGCCWAYSCNQVIEHQLMVHRNIKLQLSVQQLVDCDASNDACEGGWPSKLRLRARARILNGVLYF
jgi:hypothetical protein